MYEIKDTTIGKLYNKETMAKIVGLNPATLRRVFNKKQQCSKLVAYCITKFIDKDAEITDYFEKKGE